MHWFLWKISGICRCAAPFVKKGSKPRWLDKEFFGVFFLVLLQNPALSDDIETEMNSWQEPIESPPPNLSSSIYKIVTVDTLTVLDTSCASQWSYWLLELPNSHSTAASCSVSLCYISSWCSLQSSLQATQGLALCVSVCLFLIPFQGGLICPSSVSGFCAQIVQATAWVAWVLNSVWLQDRTWRVTYLMKTRRFCWNSYLKMGEESTACCNVAIGATVCCIPTGIKVFCTGSHCPSLSVVLWGRSVIPGGRCSGSRMKCWECLFPWLGWRCCSAGTFPLLPCWTYGLASSLVCVKLTCLSLTLWLLQRCHVTDESKRDLSCLCLACACCR